MDRGYIPVINIGGFERYVHAVEKECKRYGVPAPDRAEIVEYAQTCMCKRAFEAWRKDELETMQQIEAENVAVVQADIKRMAKKVVEETLRNMLDLPYMSSSEDKGMETAGQCLEQQGKKRKEWAARFKVWAVYETECPDSGFDVFIAVDEEDAKRQAVAQHGGTLDWYSAVEMEPRIVPELGDQVEYVVCEPILETEKQEQPVYQFHELQRKLHAAQAQELEKAISEFDERLREQKSADCNEAVHQHIDYSHNTTDIQKDISSEVGDPDGQPCPEDP